MQGTFVAQEYVPAACCPPAPIDDAQYLADKEQRKELEAAIAAAKAEGEKEGGK